MAVIFDCPGLAENGHGQTATTVHMFDCCAKFAQKPVDEQEATGLQLPAPEVPQLLEFLRPRALAILVAVASGRAWWVVQRSATYGHIEGRRCTKTLRFLAEQGAVTLPDRSGWCLPAHVGRAALTRYSDREKQARWP
jgi:hypothetical protein